MFPFTAENDHYDHVHASLDKGLFPTSQDHASLCSLHSWQLAVCCAAAFGSTDQREDSAPARPCRAGNHGGSTGSKGRFCSPPTWFARRRKAEKTTDSNKLLTSFNNLFTCSVAETSMT